MYNIMYSGNYGIFKGILTSVMSLVKFNAEPIHLYLLTMDLTDKDPKYRPLSTAQNDYLKQILQKRNPASDCTLLDLTKYYRQDTKTSILVEKKFTPYTLLRLYADQLPELPDHILYLDADTLILGSLAELFAIDITNYEFAAAKDYFGKFFLGWHHFNAGVLWLNLAMIRQTQLFPKARQLLCQKNLMLADQSALNQCATKRLLISPKFNSQRRINKNTVIRHYNASWRFFPYIHLKTVKQWDTDIVLKDKHQVYNNPTVTAILQDYLHLKDQIPHLL